MLHKPAVYAGNNRWLHIKFICFMSLNNFMFNWLYIFSCCIWCKGYPFANRMDSGFDYNPKLTQHQIIYELRLPRVIGAAIVGACFCSGWRCYARSNTKSFSGCRCAWHKCRCYVCSST